MVILIGGSSHTGKTLLAQKLMEKLSYSYLSIDHLKTGLIRAGYCPLNPCSEDGALTEYLWKVVREIIKTNLENGQNIIIEGCYIPFNFKKDFTSEQLKDIRYTCLVLSDMYIHKHFSGILEHENAIEVRKVPSDITPMLMFDENVANLSACKKHRLDYILIEDKFNISDMVRKMQAKLALK